MLGPLMIDIEGCTLSAADREVLRHPQVGGVILFARNYQDPTQLAALTADIHGLREPRLLIAVDQEGGRVQRFRHGFVELPALATLGDLYDREPDAALALAADCAWMMASELRAVGIDFSFAPVLDLRTAHSAVIGDRALHTEPRVVARLAQAYVGSLHASGMVAVGKHFPGHGCVAADSHHELPIDERDLYDIEQADLLPFRTLVRAGLEGIMMAHVLYPRVDSVAAGYSKRWIGDILRTDMRFEGVVFSDDLSMAGAALDASGSYAARAELALAAGCDVLLVCNRREAVIEILDALGRQARFPRTQARLTRMHARGTAPDLATLQASSRWTDVAARLGDLNRCPELELGDDNLLA
ncbi:MAG: beta-N-acetylhexosaminidase [Gammaproteobacteria bacterium]